MDLDHDAMAFEKDVVAIAERDGKERGRVWFERRGVFVAFVEAAAADFHGDGEFIAVEGLSVVAGLGPSVGVPIILDGVVGIDVDQLDDEVTVSARGGSVELGGDGAGNGEVFVEGRAEEGEYVGAVVDEALVRDFPFAPVAARIGG